jgi:hypothetical protein
MKLLVRFDGVLDVRELFEPPARDRSPQLGSNRRLWLELRLAGLHDEQVAPALKGLVHSNEVANTRQVIGIELNDLSQDRHERRIALDVFSID